MEMKVYTTSTNFGEFSIDFYDTLGPWNGTGV